MITRTRILTVAGIGFAAVLMIAGGAARAADDNAHDARITIKNHVFDPAELTIPAGQKVKIIVKNEDADAAEFESFELNREKVVPANSEVSVYVGPLDAGSYPFFNDFDPNKTKGKIIAK